MKLDQSQEHSIKFLKEDSGPKGLCGKSKTDEKLVIEPSKPEVLRIIDEFESWCFSDDSHFGNHKENAEASAQNKNQTVRLLNLVDDEPIINPYKEPDGHLVTLDTAKYMNPEISHTLISLETVALVCNYMKNMSRRELKIAQYQSVT